LDLWINGWLDFSTGARHTVGPSGHLSPHSSIHFFLMATQAQISSVEALEAFRADLVVFLAQIKPVLDEISSEVLRTRSWLEDDRKRFWLQEMRTRTRKLEDAKQELFTASISKMGDTASFQQMAVQKAQRAVREVEEKMTVIKRWDRDLDNKTAPLVKQMEQLHGFLAVEMEKAVAYLDQVNAALRAYQSVAPPAGKSSSSPSSSS
jgi:hypothetical protein